MVVLVALWACSGVLGAVDLKTTALFEASLDNTQVVPPAELSAHKGTAKIQYNLNSRSLSWTVDHTVFDATGASINGPAEPGSNGAVAITISNAKTPITGSQTLGSDEEESLMAGLLYIVISSPAYPEGDIRGQIVRSKSKYKSTLSGSAFAPPVVSNSTGTASFEYDHTEQSLTFTLTHNVTDPVSIALHGPADESQIAPEAFKFPNARATVTGTFKFNVSNEVVLFDNLYYINITSRAHPTGELRGQVTYDEGDKNDSSSGMAWWKILLLIIGIVAVVGLIGAGAYFGLRYYKKKKTYKAQGEQFADPLLK